MYFLYLLEIDQTKHHGNESHQKSSWLPTSLGTAQLAASLLRENELSKEGMGLMKPFTYSSLVRSFGGSFDVSPFSCYSVFFFGAGSECVYSAC